MSYSLVLFGPLALTVNPATGTVARIVCRATGAPAEGLYRQAYIEAAIAAALRATRAPLTPRV